MKIATTTTKGWSHTVHFLLPNRVNQRRGFRCWFRYHECSCRKDGFVAAFHVYHYNGIARVSNNSVFEWGLNEVLLTPLVFIFNHFKFPTCCLALAAPEENIMEIIFRATKRYLSIQWRITIITLNRIRPALPYGNMSFLRVHHKSAFIVRGPLSTINFWKWTDFCQQFIFESGWWTWRKKLWKLRCCHMATLARFGLIRTTTNINDNTAGKVKTATKSNEKSTWKLISTLSKCFILGFDKSHNRQTSYFVYLLAECDVSNTGLYWFLMSIGAFSCSQSNQFRRNVYFWTAIHIVVRLLEILINSVAI